MIENETLRLGIIALVLVALALSVSGGIVWLDRHSPEDGDRP